MATIGSESQVVALAALAAKGLEEGAAGCEAKLGLAAPLSAPLFPPVCLSFWLEFKLFPTPAAKFGGIQDQPYMKDFLPVHVCKLAMAEHEKNWQRIGDPDRVKRSLSKHKASDYLLSDLLFARQDGESLVGVLCGRPGKRMRYYRHRRGARGYTKGSIYNNMFRADILEQAVLELMGQIIQDAPRLREQILKTIQQQSALMNHDEAALEQLQKQREQVRKKTELIVSILDEQTLADAQPEIERLKIERQNLNQKIAELEAAGWMQKIDPEALANQIIAELTALPDNIRSMPTFALRQFLASFIERADADMQTKHVEFTLKLPAWAFAQNSTDPAMRLVATSRPPTGNQTHPVFSVKLGFVDCRYIKTAPNQSCYACKRRRAA